MEKISMGRVYALSAFLGGLGTQKLPVKTAYKLAKIQQAVQEEIGFFQTKLNEIFAVYAEKDEQGQPKTTKEGGIELIPETQPQAMEKIGELENLIVELNVPLLTLEELEAVDMTLQEFDLIMPLIKDPETA